MKKIFESAKNSFSSTKLGQTEIGQRLVAETPDFWKKVGMVGLCVAGVGTLITTLPVSLPASIIAWGGYLITAGGALSGISIFAKK